MLDLRHQHRDHRTTGGRLCSGDVSHGAYEAGDGGKAAKEALIYLRGIPDLQWSRARLQRLHSDAVASSARSAWFPMIPMSAKTHVVEANQEIMAMASIGRKSARPWAFPASAEGHRRPLL